MTDRARGMRILQAGAVAFGLVAMAAAWLPGQALAQSGEMRRVVPDSRQQVQLSFAPVVKAAAPAVVNVYAARRVRTRGAMGMDDFFRQFFGGGRSFMPEERVENSLGSGVIVRADGIVVTNNHVIKGGEEFTIVLQDRREFDAEVLLTDERTDLAVLKIDTDGEALPAVEFRNSDDIDVGDLVLAIGNPFGVGQTVTSGIISALARTQIGITDYGFFIQTDAAINPGNSGGALVSGDGRLIGINTAIFSRSGGSNGIGFAIPSNMVRLVVDSAVAGERLVRPWLGASYQPVSSEIAESLGRDRPGGALITELYPDGPAEQAGLRAGDVIVSIEGFDVVDPGGLRYRVATRRPGEDTAISYWRKGRLRTAKIRVQPLPGSSDPEPKVITASSPLSGATVVTLSPAFNEEHGLDPMQQGVVVVGTARGSFARQSRFRSGDIILSVDGARVTSVKELERAIRRNDLEWAIEIKRGERTGVIRYTR